MHVMETLVDLLKLTMVSNIFIHLDLSREVIYENSRMSEFLLVN